MIDDQPTPDTRALCAQCDAIFSELPVFDARGDPPYGYSQRVHHPSTASFEAAVAFGCPICFRIRTALWRNGHEDLASIAKPGSFSHWDIRQSYKGASHLYNLHFMVFYADRKDYVQANGDPAQETWFLLSQQIYPLKVYDGPAIRAQAHWGLGTSSREAWSQAFQWWNECRNTHQLCNKANTSPNATEPYLPTRVLDISGDGTQLRLVITSKECRQAGYATLSHCWGRCKVLTLTKGNMAALQQNISVDDLPLTFREAVEVARRFDIFYLWIDSLCIVQDSLEDWQTESARMGDVYSNGVLNIMATASHDGRGGLFRNRDARELDPCIIRSRWAGMDSDMLWVASAEWDQLITAAPLNQRGWVLQERILAPRALHYGYNQLAWECHEKDACEMYPAGLPRVMVNRNTRVKATSVDEFRDWYAGWSGNWATRHVGYDIWARNVSLYSRTAVTKPSDKLVAISGLAKRMRNVLQDQYLAGLWVRDLPTQLLWFVTKSTPPSAYRPVQYRAPSWSWASLEGPVHMMSWTKDWDPSVHIEVDDVRVSPLSSLDDTAEVVDGYIRLRGCLIAAELVSPDTTVARLEVDIRVDGRKIYSRLELDEPIRFEHAPLLILPVCRIDKVTPRGPIFGLLLCPVQDKPRGWYSRIGMIIMQNHEDVWKYVDNCMDDPEFSDETLCLDGSPRSVMYI